MAQENGELTLLGKLSKWLVPTLLVIIGVLLMAAWNDLKAGQIANAAEASALRSEISELKTEVASLKASLNFIYRFGVPAGPFDVAKRTTP